MDREVREAKAAAGIAERRARRAETAVLAARRAAANAEAAAREAADEATRAHAQIGEASARFDSLPPAEKLRQFERHEAHRERLIMAAQRALEEASTARARLEQARELLRDAQAAAARADVRSEAVRTRARCVSRKAAGRRDAKVAEEAAESRPAQGGAAW